MENTGLYDLEDIESQIIKTHIYHFPIEEVFKAFTNKELICDIYQQRVKIISSLREDSFIEDVGNEISIITPLQYNIILKVIKVIKSKNYYLLELKTIQHPLDYCAYTMREEFFWNSHKNVTIFNGQLTIAKCSSQEEIVKYLKKSKIFLTEEIEGYLKKTVKNLEQNESILINTSLQKIWNFVTQVQNIVYFLNVPDISIVRESNEIIKVVGKKNNNNIFRLLVKEKKEEDDKYTLFLYSFDSLVVMPLQSMQIQVVKVNDNMSLLIYKHIILEYIPYDALKSNSRCKQRILQNIKEILEKQK